MTSAGRSDGLIGVTAAPNAPRREQRHHEAGGVGQHDGDDIAGRYPMAAQRRRRAPDGGKELGVVQIGLVVGDGGAQWVLRGALIGKCR